MPSKQSFPGSFKKRWRSAGSARSRCVPPVWSGKDQDRPRRCRLIQHFLIYDVVADRLAVEHGEDVLDRAILMRSTTSRLAPAAAIKLSSPEFGAQRFSGMVEKQANFGREVAAFRVHDMNGCGWGFVFDENGLQ